MDEFTFGILLGTFLGIVITMIGLLIAAAAGPSNEFDDIYDDIKDE